MSKVISILLALFWSCLAIAEEVHDAPIPTEMNWAGIIAFAVIFFGLSGGFVFMVWKNAQKKNDEKKPDA
jgi:heme/copper-type cytochrome/quinol oxidase subunit 2